MANTLSGQLERLSLVILVPWHVWLPGTLSHAYVVPYYIIEQPANVQCRYSVMQPIHFFIELGRNHSFSTGIC